MVLACRKKMPDISLAEIETVFRVNLRRSLSRNIQNPVGYLIWKIPESCTPAAIAALRQGREVPAENRQLEFSDVDLAAMLDDPSTPPVMRKLIALRLGKELTELRQES
jgi:hypothetical protein